MTTINLDQQLHQHADVIEKIITTCQRLHARNMLSAADGNISYRVNNNFILITPSGIAKAFMTAKDIAIIKDTTKNVESFARLDGKNVVTLNIVKRSGENLIETSEAVQKIEKE